MHVGVDVGNDLHLSDMLDIDEQGIKYCLKFSSRNCRYCAASITALE